MMSAWCLITYLHSDDVGMVFDHLLEYEVFPRLPVQGFDGAVRIIFHIRVASRQDVVGHHREATCGHNLAQSWRTMEAPLRHIYSTNLVFTG